MSTFSQVDQWVNVERYSNPDYIICDKTSACISATDSPLVGTFVQDLATGAAGNVIYVNTVGTSVEIACITATQFTNSQISYTLGTSARTANLSAVSVTHGTHNKSLADLTDRTYYSYRNSVKSGVYSNGTLYLKNASNITLSTLGLAESLVTTSNSVHSTLYLKAGTRTVSTISLDRYTVTTSNDKLVLKNTFNAYSTTVSCTFANHSLSLASSCVRLANKSGTILNYVNVGHSLTQAGNRLNLKIGNYITSTLTINPTFADHSLSWNGLNLSLYNKNSTNISDVNLRFANGSAGAPAISFNAATNTGLYYVPGQLRAAIGGSTKLMIDATALNIPRQLGLHPGNVAVDGAYWKLACYDMTSIYLQNGRANIRFIGDNTYQALRLFSTLSVGTQLKSTPDEFSIWHTSGYTPFKWTRPNNTTVIGSCLSVTGHLYVGSSGINTAGTCTAVNFNATSLRSSKENIVPFIESAVDVINDVDIVSFNYKGDIGKNKKIGFIADDTHDYLSTINHDQMDLTNNIGLLLKAVQELSAEVVQLKEKINILEQK